MTDVERQNADDFVMQNLCIGEIIRLGIPTQFGIIPVDFTILAVYPCDRALMIAQDRVVMAERKTIHEWSISDPIDLLDINVKKQSLYVVS
jgi:hypothetical protein